MKLLKVLLAAGSFCGASLMAQTADNYVTQGRAALAAHNPVGAYSNFNAALVLSPTNNAANALAAAARLLLFPQQAPGSNFLNRLGFSKQGRSIYNWTSSVPRGANGIILPANLNSSEAISLYRASLVPALGASRSNLARIQDANFTLPLTAAETGVEDVTLDYGDFLLLRSELQAAEFLGYTLNAQNFDVVINHLQALSQAGQLTIQRVLADYPSLLTQVSKTDLANSKRAFTNSILLYFQASDFIRNTRPPAAERLFELPPDEATNEAAFRADLSNALASVSQPVQVALDSQDMISVCLGAYFGGAKSLRSLLPRFSDDRYVYNSLPDYTLGGILFNEPAFLTESYLRQRWGRYFTGVYLGEFVEYLDNYSGFGGNFAMMVRSNQTVELAGYDNGVLSGAYLEFKLQDDGSWNFTNGLVSSFGQIYSDGSFYGEVDVTNGVITADGNVVPVDAGPFQDAAGYYTGTYTGTQSGALKAVLSSAGDIDYCVFDRHGQITDGGPSTPYELDPNTGQFDTFSVNNTEIIGALNINTLKITGTYNNPYTTSSGTFTMSRTDYVPFDVPPAVVGSSGDQTVMLGRKAAFSVKATGSPPLCYQWYSNNAPIIGATAPTLMVSNVQFADYGTVYQVQVQNCAGLDATNAILTVVPETNRPTVSITSPKAGQLWSNALFTVTGTASDDLAGGVYGAWYHLNGGPWLPVTGTTNWSAPLVLAPGTNSIQAFSQNTSGNFSITNGVSLFYVVMSPLTLVTNGSGTISRQFKGLVLDVGRDYAVTGVPGTGQVFSNWLDGAGNVISTSATMNFEMQSNLELRVNFVPNRFPAVAGVYNGLFYDTNGVEQESSGFITISLTPNGACSGNLQVGGSRLPFAGQFSAAGNADFLVPRTGTNPLTAELTLSFAPGADRMAGAISDGHWLAELNADRAFFNATTNKALAYAGNYTMLIPGVDPLVLLPEGNGYGAVAVDAGGNVTVTGALADGTPLNTAANQPLAAPVSRDGQWPVYAPLYGGKGSVVGWMSFGPPADLQGWLNWIKPASPTNKLYTNGFTMLVTNVEGSRYTIPSATNRVMNLTNGFLIFDGGHLSGPFTNAVYLTSGNHVTNDGSTNALTFTLTPSKGTFNGSVKVPGAMRSLIFNGALLTNQDLGAGFFLDTNLSGSVFLISQ